jgi:hypothetical protein
MVETTSEATTSEIWYGPEAGEMKVGWGNPSDDIARKPDPWDVLRFHRGFLTIDTASEHYAQTAN